MRRLQETRPTPGFLVSVWRSLCARRHAARREGGDQRRGLSRGHRGHGRRERGCLAPPATPPFFAVSARADMEGFAIATARCGLCEKNCPLSAPGCPKGAALQAQQRW